jgi:hypothetical protein
METDMNNEHTRRGGSHSIEDLDAEVFGRQAAGEGKPRTENPHAVGSSLHAYWLIGHDSVTGFKEGAAKMEAPAKTEAAAEAAPNTGDSLVKAETAENGNDRQRRNQR